MPRPRRCLPVGHPVHVTNRGNDRRTVFLTDADFLAFLRLLEDGIHRFPVDLDAYCAMPNHFHLVLRQREPWAISAYLHRVTFLSACNLRESTATQGFGHVFQRRFWSRVVEEDSDYLTVLRYVEANPIRAKLVERSEDWVWGSVWERVTGGRTLLSPPRVKLPPGWCEIVNAPQPDEELDWLRRPARRGRPPTGTGKGARPLSEMP